jgi:hypothetical protein
MANSVRTCKFTHNSVIILWSSVRNQLKEDLMSTDNLLKDEPGNRSSISAF